MPRLRAIVRVILIGLAVPVTGTAAGATCQDLLQLPAANTAITLAEQVPAGGFQKFPTLPGFCRVAATLRPSADSDIKIEVWLPASQWNGRFQAIGNGGWAGSIPYPQMAAALATGYATAGTDTGHTGGNAAFAVGHPEKVIDMGYRAVHEMTAQAKAIINSFYGRATQFSIWNGCSTGGRQGITEAVRYPSDFDAVIAGAPAVNWMQRSRVERVSSGSIAGTSIRLRWTRGRPGPCSAAFPKTFSQSPRAAWRIRRTSRQPRKPAPTRS